MTALLSAPPRPPRSTWRRWAPPATSQSLTGRLRKKAPRFLVAGVIVGVLLAAGLQAGYIAVCRNFHTVLPGRVYRAAQMSGDELRSALEKYQVRTVLNLRGWDAADWYSAECRLLDEVGVKGEDINFVTGRLPWVHELERLLDVLDHCEYPILMHCYSGADRSGMVSALILLLNTDCDLDEACRQLGVRYGHFSFKAPAMDQFFDLYANWLHDQQRSHSPAALRWWIEHDYCPGPYRCLLEPVDVPEHLPLDQPAAVRVRVHNTSIESWHFSQVHNGGVHVGFFLSGADHYQFEGRAGKLDAKVAPGETMDVTLVLPAIKRPGVYGLVIDLVDDEGGNWFSWVGNPRLEAAIEFR